MPGFIRMLPAFLMLAGCYSMDVASNSALNPDPARKNTAVATEHVVVSNYGWYLFNTIPLACGNAMPDAVLPWRFFSDQVSSKLLHDRMMSYAARRHADVRDLVFFRDEEVFFTLPGLAYPLPIPYLLCFREEQFSCVLVPNFEDDSGGAQ